MISHKNVGDSIVCKKTKRKGFVVYTYHKGEFIKVMISKKKGYFYIPKRRMLYIKKVLTEKYIFDQWEQK